MFFELKNASKIEGLENLVTDEVTNMSSMFWACEILSDLDLTSFNTSNVTNMTAMFQYCYNMQTLDLSSFDLSNLDRAREMFSNCGVKTIYCTQDLSAQSLKEKNNMFSYSSVVGGKGTVLDSRYESNEYARPDGGVERPGYFTLPTEEALIDGVNYLLDNKTLTAEVIALPEGKYEEEVFIPEKVKYFVKEYTVTGIGDKAFKGCDGLTSLTLESTTPLEVGEGAFEGVPKDLAIYVPDESKSLYEEAEGWKEFEDFHFTPIVIDGICYELDPNTYYAKVVALPQGKYKGNIVLPEDVTFEGVKYKVGQIGKGAFARCGELESLSLPATINEIEDMAIVGNPRLITLNVAELNLKYSDKEGVLFNASGNTLLIYPTGRYGGYSVPEGTKRIEHHAFIGADLKMMFLPESLEEIGAFAFDQTSLLWMGIKAATPPAADDMAFYGVNNMIPIYVPDESIESYRDAKEWKEFSNIVKGIVRNVSIGDLIYDLYRWDHTAEVVGTVEDNPTGMIEIPEQIEVAFELAGVPARRTDAAHMPQGGEPTPSSVKYRVVSIGKQITPFNFRLEKDTFLRAIFIEEDKEPEIPQFTMQVTSAEIKWWKKDDAFFYSLAVYLDEAMTNLFATFLFDKNGYIVDVVLLTQAPRRAMKEEQETEFQYTISGLSADTKYYYRMETRDESERLIYTDEELQMTKDELESVKALAEQYEASAIEAELSSAISTANDLLNSADVTSAEVYAAIITAQAELTNAMIELLDIAKQQLDDSLDALLKEGDSEACQQIIVDAKEQVELLDIDWTKSIADIISALTTNGQSIYDQAVLDIEAQRKSEQAPTGIIDVQRDDVPCTKVLRNGVLYLLYEGLMYDVQGLMVK